MKRIATIFGTVSHSSCNWTPFFSKKQLCRETMPSSVSLQRCPNTDTTGIHYDRPGCPIHGYTSICLWGALRCFEVLWFGYRVSWPTHLASQKHSGLESMRYCLWGSRIPVVSVLWHPSVVLAHLNSRSFIMDILNEFISCAFVCDTSAQTNHWNILVDVIISEIRVRRLTLRENSERMYSSLPLQGTTQIVGTLSFLRCSNSLSFKSWLVCSWSEVKPRLHIILDRRRYIRHRSRRQFFVIAISRTE